MASGRRRTRGAAKNKEREQLSVPENEPATPGLSGPQVPLITVTTTGLRPLLQKYDFEEAAIRRFEAMPSDEHLEALLGMHQVLKSDNDRIKLDYQDSMHLAHCLMEELEETNAAYGNKISLWLEAESRLSAAESHCQSLEQQRNEVGYQLSQLLSNSVGSHKSTKMPDPPMFNDGKTYPFESWVATVRRTLQINADHYPTRDSRLLYVSSRCEGTAQMLIAPRLDPESDNAFQDAEDIIAYLEIVFGNPYRKEKS